MINNNIRFELSFKNIPQLEKKINFCKLNNIKNINIPCKGYIKKELFNLAINFISKNYHEFNSENQIQSGKKSVADELTKLKELYNDGVLNKEQFEAAKKKILS